MEKPPLPSSDTFSVYSQRQRLSIPSMDRSTFNSFETHNGKTQCGRTGKAILKRINGERKTSYGSDDSNSHNKGFGVKT